MVSNDTETSVSGADVSVNEENDNESVMQSVFLWYSALYL